MKRPPRSWVHREVSSEHVHSLALETGLSPLVIQVCVQRGLESKEQIELFLNPRLDQLTDPFQIRDMDRAVERLVTARARGETVLLYGDYDVDGTTGIALLKLCLGQMGLKTRERQPDRFKEGYGLHVQAIEDTAAEKIPLIVAVDCGITAFDPAAKARDLGIDLIVVDHHQVDPERGLPDAHAILDPQRADCPSGLKQLCGCGLAFMLARALRTRGIQEGWFAQSAPPNLRQHLDLVVMATAADLVPLTGDNRILVKHGFQVLKDSKKPGVRALLSVCGIDVGKVSPMHLGFAIGPRINASGRMDSAGFALELLTTDAPLRAQELALKLEALNKERMEIQNRIWDQVRKRVDAAIKEGRYAHAVVVADSDWHEGVIGIVASRVAEEFRRPAIVISIGDNGRAKGSVRSYAGKDVLAGLRQCQGDLLGFGGHRHAAGLTVSESHLAAFESHYNEAMSQLPEEAGASSLVLEGVCAFSDLTPLALHQLESMGPFGPGNPEPIFEVQAQVSDHRVLKERHLKLELEVRGQIMEAIWFNVAERPRQVQFVVNSGKSRWAAVPELNRFRNKVTPTLRIRDWKEI